MKVFGVDISRYQGNVNFDFAIKDRPDLDSVVIKCSQGGNGKIFDCNPYADPNFKSNIEKANSSHLNIGVYHYITGGTVNDAIKEANYVISLIAPYKKMINLFVACDMEDMDGCPKYSKNSKNSNTAIVRAFCDQISSAGYRSCLYTNKVFYFNYMDRNVLSDIPVWYARWSQTEDVVKKEISNLIGWQYGTEVIAGLGASVDANYFYIPEKIIEKEEEKIEKEKRYNTKEEIISEFPWAKETIDNLIYEGVLKGDGSGFDLSKDMIRTFVILDRAGVFN